MDKLWQFASNADSFELKDIVAALDEIQVDLCSCCCLTASAGVGGCFPRFYHKPFFRFGRRSWKNLKEGEQQTLSCVKRASPTSCACWVKTWVASISPRLAESAQGFCSSVLAWVFSAAANRQDFATSLNAASVAARKCNVAESLTCRLLKTTIKTSTSTSPLTTTMILRRKNKILMKNKIWKMTPLKVRKTSTSTSPLTTAMILRRRNKIWKMTPLKAKNDFEDKCDIVCIIHFVVLLVGAFIFWKIYSYIFYKKARPSACKYNILSLW